MRHRNPFNRRTLKPVVGIQRRIGLDAALSREIARRIRTEDELRAHEELARQRDLEFRTLINAIPDRITLLTADLHLGWSNKEAEPEYSRPHGDPSSPTCYGRWHGRAEPCEPCPVQRCLVSGQTEDQLNRAPDGSYWGVKAFPMRDETGGIAHVIHVASDVTEKVRMRQEAERSGRLASLGQLAAGVAHEINNPNALTLHNVPMLQEAWEDIQRILDEVQAEKGDFTLGRMPYSRLRDQIPRMHEQILEGSRRIRGIVEDLKDFVRQGDLSVLEPVDLNAVVQFAVRLATNTIKVSTDHFAVSYAEALPPFMGAPQRIEQVVVNLIMNACQALPVRSRAVRVETCYDSSLRRSMVRVADEGSGIDEENLSHILEPFFTTKRQQGGTGLGLSIAARIVREHQGELTFDSTPGQGTLVTIAFPVAKETPR
ncbi:MAG: ATP-binding protein [Desulfuromonadales bacterium]|nr:ATP-binding protein [Desulfuromonadales bacterium]MDW7757946.1 ATP-binding protein [Desulfuromonadales bacterium]